MWSKSGYPRGIPTPTRTSIYKKCRFLSSTCETYDSRCHEKYHAPFATDLIHWALANRTVRVPRHLSSPIKSSVVLALAVTWISPAEAVSKQVHALQDAKQRISIKRIACASFVMTDIVRHDRR